MNASDILAILKAVDPRRKPLERLGAFLCRRKIAALEHDLAAARADVEELADERGELRRELEAQKEQNAALERRLDFRARFRRVTVGAFFHVYREREGGGDGAPPCLACPVCYERGKLGIVFPSFKKSTVAVNGAVGVKQERVHLRCLNEGCRFHVIVAPEALGKAYQLAD